MLMEHLPSETGYFRHVHWPVCCDSDAVDYLFGCCEGTLWCETIEHSELIFVTEEPPCVSPGTIFLEGEEGEWWGLGRHFVRQFEMSEKTEIKEDTMVVQLKGRLKSTLPRMLERFEAAMELGSL